MKKYAEKKISLEFNSYGKFTVCYFFHIVAHSGMKIKNAVNCSISQLSQHGSQCFVQSLQIKV